jgi:hypothetical protein
MNRRHVKSLVLLIGLLVQATLLYMPSSPTLAETGRTTTTVTSTITSTVTATTTTTTTLTAEAADFQIIIFPSQKVVNPGGSPTFSVLVQRWKYTLFTDVSLTLEGAPATFSYNFDPPSSRTDFSSVLSITVNPDTPKGEYALTVVGFGDGKYRRAGLSLIVTGGSDDADFMVSLSPHTLAVKRPESGTISTQTTITVKSLNGYSGNISLTCGWIPMSPGGTSTSLEFTELRVEADSEVSTNLIITIDSSASLGNFTLFVYGNDGVKTRYDVAYPYISAEPSYLINVVSHPISGLPIDLSGDVTGKGVTPFEIGPRKTRLSVTLTAPSTALASGQAGGQLIYTFSKWLLDKAEWEGNILPVQTSQEQNVRTADAHYFLSHPIYVTIHTPTNGTIVSGLVPIVASVNCSQGHPIASCRYKVDAGAWVDMLWNGTHWIAQWDSTGVSNNLHRITVRGACSHDAYGEAWVEVITDNAPPQPVYTYYVNHVSGVWTPSRKFLPGEMMGVDYYDPSMAGKTVTISLSADIVYTPKTPSRTQSVFGNGRATFALKFEHTICGEYIVTWSWMDGDQSRSFQTTFKVVGAKATQWTVSHLYDGCQVHVLLRWDDAESNPIMNRQGTIEAYSIYGPYQNMVKGTIAADGGIIVRNIPYYDWSGDATFTIAYLGTDIKILTGTGQENVKTFHCDVLAAIYTLQGQDYSMTAQVTFFLKYRPATKVQGALLSVSCPETYDWAKCRQLSNEYGQTSATISVSGTPLYFKLLSWTWLSQPPPALCDYIIAGHYANLKVAEERVAVQPTIIRAGSPYLTIRVQMISQTQWMDLSAGNVTVRVEVWNVAETEKVASGDFHVAVPHGTVSQYDLQVNGAGAGTWTIKICVYYFNKPIGQTQATVTAA